MRPIPNTTIAAAENESRKDNTLNLDLTSAPILGARAKVKPADAIKIATTVKYPVNEFPNSEFVIPKLFLSKSLLMSL